MKNFHLPLPDGTYAELRAEVERSKIPATSLAREAIELWLRDRKRKLRHEAIAAYASQMAGASFDLDPELESVSLDHLKTRGHVGPKLPLCRRASARRPRIPD